MKYSKNWYLNSPLWHMKQTTCQFLEPFQLVPPTRQVTCGVIHLQLHSFLENENYINALWPSDTIWHQDIFITLSMASNKSHTIDFTNNDSLYTINDEPVSWCFYICLAVPRSERVKDKTYICYHDLHRTVTQYLSLPLWLWPVDKYHKTSNIRDTKSQNLNISCLVL